MTIRLALAAVAVTIAAPGLTITLVGEPVAKIYYADQIDGFKHIDARHLVLNVGPEGNYLLKFQNDCYRLRYADHVGVSASNNTIYAGFDYVTADGFQCPIQSIERVELEEEEWSRL